MAVTFSLVSMAIAQEAQQTTPESVSPATPDSTVLFDSRQNPVVGAKRPEVINEDPAAATSDTDRSALTFTSYDLDAHLVPARSRLVMRARFSVRNDGVQALTRVAFQISSSLQWERFVLLGGASPVSIPFVQHQINTDADHTGQAQEAILTLPQPLQPGSTIEVSSFYSGELTQSAKRLERIGAPAIQAAFADWDSVTSASTALRGFGNVLWYPTSSAPVFLGEGASLFQAVGRTKLRQADSIIRLRLTVEYVGDPPDAVYFCGQRQPLMHVSENADEPVAEAPGLATVEFSPQRLGFRVPSLFITDRTASKVGMLISAVTDRREALPLYAAAGGKVEPLLEDWLGKTPRVTLNILDHDGQPFEDGALLVSPMSAKDSSVLSYVLVHSLAHAWFSSPQVWLDEGVAQFLSLLWIEQSEGRDAAIRMLQHQSNTLALAEPAVTQASGTSTEDQTLIRARDEVYYRTKAAAVLWMLRSVGGDAGLKQALQLYRHEGKQDEDPKEFERVLEQVLHKDLRWFFDDWVYHDRGLPDLSIVSIMPRELPAQGDKSGGWLIAVEVHNDGDAVAEVPVTVRSGTLSATERIRIPGRSSTSTRIVFEGDPAEVTVNDGSVPEIRATTHSMQVVIREK
jgi:hypothetical protein